MSRVLQAVTAAAALMVVGIPASARGADPDPAVIDRLIEELGSPQFARREAAAKGLVEAGRPALASLAGAIRGGDFEVASRAVEVLCELLGAADADLAAEAEGLLEQAAEQGGSAARVAAAALDFHHVGMASSAREQLESLGAIFRERPFVEQAGIEAEFGAGWKGTAADLRQLARLRGLTGVGFHGVRLDEAALAVVGRLARLERIELFGTGVSDEAVAALATRLPAARIDFRKGGKLGVGALAFGGPCEIRTVEPGSAADQAGVRPGDVVLAVDGQPVADFDGLTARMAGRGPGERVRLTVARGGAADGDVEQLELSARLDAW